MNPAVLLQLIHDLAQRNMQLAEEVRQLKAQLAETKPAEETK